MSHVKELMDKIINILKQREFVSVATSDLESQPNAAPKFLLRAEDSYIILVDYTIGKTWTNLKANPRVSLSFVDTETLLAYQVNGSVEIIEEGSEYEKMVKELHDKEVILSAKRLIEGITSGKRHSNFEVAIRKKNVFMKVSIEEIAEIGTRGEVKREKICRT